jgi:hypothetical protein
VEEPPLLAQVPGRIDITNKTISNKNINKVLFY